MPWTMAGTNRRSINNCSMHYLHFIDEKNWGWERSWNVPELTQLSVSSGSLNSNINLSNSNFLSARLRLALERPTLRGQWPIWEAVVSRQWAQEIRANGNHTPKAVDLVCLGPSPCRQVLNCLQPEKQALWPENTKRTNGFVFQVQVWRIRPDSPTKQLRNFPIV